MSNNSSNNNGVYIKDVAIDEVRKRSFEASNYASTAFNIAQSHLVALYQLASSLKHIEFNCVSPIPPANFQPANVTRPAKPCLNSAFPYQPSPPNFYQLPTFSIAFPSFNLQMPPINIPNIPDVGQFTPPSPPSIQEPEIPEAPDITLPSEPPFNFPTIPEIPHPEFPEIEATPPDAEGLIAPDISISDGGKDFTLIQGLKERIEDLIANERPAFSKEIEDILLARESEQAQLILYETIDRICAEWSKRRAVLPDGVLVAMLQEAQINFQNKQQDTLRDITLKNYELTQQNIYKAIEAGISLQNIYMTVENLVAQRVYEASKSVAEGMISLYNAGIKKYEALVETYKTIAAVYETRIRAELGKIDYYKAMIESAKVITDINDSMIKQYVAKLNGIESLINIYRQKMEAAKVFTDVQKIRLDIYRSLIESFIANINAKTAEYSMYRAKIEGEVAKVEIYGKQVEAYKAQVQALSAQMEGEIEKLKGYADMNKSMAQLYASQVDAYRGLIQAEVARIEGQTRLFIGEVDAYKGEVQAEAIRVDSQARVYEADVKRIISDAEIKIKNKEVEIKNYEHIGSLKIEAMKAIAQVASSLAIGALSALHVSAGVDAKSNVSSSFDMNYNYNYEMPVPED